MGRRRTEEVLARPTGSGVTGRPGRQPHVLLVEEPLEIRLGDDLVATTMRTPGHDFELAAGWCWAEGLLAAPPAEVRYCATGSALATGFNVVTVDPGPGTVPRGAGLDRAVASTEHVAPARLGLTGSSCGICGVDQIERLTERLDPLPDVAAPSAAVLAGLGATVAAHQELFDATGGAHGAAAFDPAGDLVVVREDIGRHNALDKVVGHLLLARELPLTGHVLWTSGRASFEMVQKAWAAGASTLVAVGAPSALAVSTAAAARMVLVAFARDGRCTVYNGEVDHNGEAGP